MSGGLSRLLGGGFIDRLRAVAPLWAVEGVVAFTCVGLSLLFRVLLDLISPGALAFGLFMGLAGGLEFLGDEGGVRPVA